jgi:hypothetical protein
VGSKFYFDYLKYKSSFEWDDGSLQEDPSKIQDMFGLHFQNIFFLFLLNERVRKDR